MAQNTYDAYGTGNISHLSPFGYCGEYLDSETGFVYLRNRYYDPSIGRFISEDPIKSGTNWYVYCENNPIRYTDSFGLDKNLDDYINANYAGKMTVTVAISRPVPNSRAVATINSSGMLDNGHSFLRLDGGNGNVKYLGLAPTEKSLTKMLLAEDVGGKMVDDSLSPWNVARVFELNSDQYNDLSAFLASAESSTPNYNIRDYNCTTFAVEGLKKAGINSYRIGIYEHSWTLPDNLYEQLKGYSARGKIPTWIATATVRTMGRFDGYTPADAAQDLKGSEGTTLLQYDSTGVKTIQNQVYWYSK